MLGNNYFRGIVVEMANMATAKLKTVDCFAFSKNSRYLTFCLQMFALTVHSLDFVTFYIPIVINQGEVNCKSTCYNNHEEE